MTYFQSSIKSCLNATANFFIRLVEVESNINNSFRNIVVQEFDNAEESFPSIAYAMDRAMNVVSDKVEGILSDQITHPFRSFDLLYFQNVGQLIRLLTVLSDEYIISFLNILRWKAQFLPFSN